MTETEKMREQILAAARERFSHYGYPKTTIAELASDCAMSAGNIYRFFAGKIEIATEIAQRETLAAVEYLENLMECPMRSARDRIEDMMFADLRHTFNLIENNPKVIELAQIVVQERPQFQLESLRRERRNIARILQRGVEDGEFEIDNISRAASALQLATTKFRFAPLFTQQNLAELERELAHVLTYMICSFLTEEGRANFIPTRVPSKDMRRPDTLSTTPENTKTRRTGSD